MGRPSHVGQCSDWVIIGHLPVTPMGTKRHQSKEPQHGGDFSWFHGTEDE